MALGDTSWEGSGSGGDWTSWFPGDTFSRDFGGGMDFSSFLPGGGGGGGFGGPGLGGFTNIDPTSGLPIGGGVSNGGGGGQPSSQPGSQPGFSFPGSQSSPLSANDFQSMLSQFLAPGANGGGDPNLNPAGKTGLDGILTTVLKLAGIFGGGDGSQNGQPGQPGSQPGGQPLGSQVLSTLAASLPRLLASGIGLYGANKAFQQQNWDNSAKINVLDWLRGQAGGAQSSLSSVNGAVTPELIKQLFTQGAAGNATQGDLTNRLQYLYNSIPGQFNTSTDSSRVPGLSGAFDLLGGAQGANNAALQKAFAMLGAGSPGLQQAQGTALDLSKGNPNLVNTGNSIVSSGGNTDFSNLLQNYGTDVLTKQGQTPQLQQLQQIAMQLIGAQHPELQAANTSASNLLSKNPLLPMDQVLSMSANSNATQQQNNLDSLRKQLLDRTGVTGPAIASGNTNDLLRELGDQALQGEAAGRAKALTDQQGLQLQQWQGAVPLINVAANAQQGYTGQGLSTDLASQAQAAQREQALPALGVSGANSSIQRLLAGAGLINDNTTMAGTGLGSFANLFNSGTSQSNGLLNAITGLLQNSGNLNQQRIDASMGLQKFGLDSSTQMQDAIAKLLGLQTNLGSSQMTNALGFGSQGNNLTQALLQYLSSSGGQQASLFNNGNSIANPLAAFLSTLNAGGSSRGII